MFEFSWNVTSKIKYKQLGGIMLMIRSNVSRKKVKNSRKDLDAVVHGSEAEAEETGLETVELSNGGKLPLFNLKDTAILKVFINCLCFLFVISLKWVYSPIFAFL